MVKKEKYYGQCGSTLLVSALDPKSMEKGYSYAIYHSPAGYNFLWLFCNFYLKGYKILGGAGNL